MTSTRIAEAKGILFLLLVIGLLATVMMATSGKLEDWFGIRLFRTPDVAGRIVVVSDRNGHNDIWVMNRDGSGQKPLTNDKFDDQSPVWSPDGTEIIFVSDRDEGRYQLYAVPYKGGRLRKVSLSSGTKSSPVISPDGKEVAFLNSGKVSVREVDGTHEHQVMPTEEQARAEINGEMNTSFLQVDWCATGDWLAAVHRVDPGEAITLLSLSNGEVGIPKDDRERPLAGEKIDIAWSSTGRRLAAAVYRGAEGNYVAVQDLDREAFYVLLKGDAAKHVALEPAWAPDDSALALVSAVVEKTGDITPTGLLLTDTGDGSTSQIDQGRCEHPKWSRDGKSIIYTKTTDDKQDIWIVDVEKREAVNLTQGKGNSSCASWAPGVPE